MQIINETIQEYIDDICEYGAFCPCEAYFNRETGQYKDYLLKEEATNETRYIDEIVRETTLFELLLNAVANKMTIQNIEIRDIKNVVLLALRYISELSQEQFAKMINISLQSCKFYDTCRRVPKLETIAQACYLENVPFDKVMEIISRGRVFDF